jgi:hypothetical protein
MKQPGLIVDTFGHLNKYPEILRLEVELAVRTAKIKAQIGCEFSFRVFTPMPPEFRARHDALKQKRRLFRITKPSDGLTRLQRDRF